MGLIQNGHNWVNRHICLDTTSHVYISDVKVRLGATLSAEIKSSAMFVNITWPQEARLPAFFVYILRHVVIDPDRIFVYITWLWRHKNSAYGVALYLYIYIYI